MKDRALLICICLLVTACGRQLKPSSSELGEEIDTADTPDLSRAYADVGDAIQSIPAQDDSQRDALLEAKDTFIQLLTLLRQFERAKYDDKIERLRERAAKLKDKLEQAQLGQLAKVYEAISKTKLVFRMSTDAQGANGKTVQTFSYTTSPAESKARVNGIAMKVFAKSFGGCNVPIRRCKDAKASPPREALVKDKCGGMEDAGMLGYVCPKKIPLLGVQPVGVFEERESKQQFITTMAGEDKGKDTKRFDFKSILGYSN